MRIEQTSVAGCIGFFKPGFLDRWKLDDYNDVNKPCFFLGIEQVDIINNHRGLKIIYPISPYDCTFLERIEYSDSIILIGSPFLPENTRYKIKNVELEIKDYSAFKPNVLGDKIYCYVGLESRKNEFDFDRICRIQERINYKIIYVNTDSLYGYLPSETLKENYYDRCFVSINLNGGTGMTTVRELGLMGRNTITNSKYNFPSMLEYEDDDDIIRLINLEAKKIGTIQPAMDCHNVNDEWLDCNFWTNDREDMKIIEMRNSSNTQGLLDLIKALPDNIIMAEIGCYAGESTSMFMQSGKVRKMYAIDIWEDELNVYENIEKNHSFRLVETKFDDATRGMNIVKLKMDAESALPELPELDVIYIDANHEYDYIKKDIETSLKRLSPGSIICGHDYNLDSPGVIRAVNEFFGKPDRIFSDSSWLVKLKNIKLVQCSETYWEFVRLLRLDKRVINGFIKTSHISTEEQSEYMKVHSKNYRVALFDGSPAGYIGVIDDDIRICTHPDFQRMGVGRFMVNECTEIWKSAFAKIKLDNYESIRFFESCGFEKKFYILKKN